MNCHYPYAYWPLLKLSVPRDASRVPLAVTLFVFLFISGCGGASTEDKFMEMAKARAARNAEEKEEEAKAEAAAAAVPPPPAAVAPTPAPAASAQAVTAQAAAPSTAAMPVAPQSGEPTVPGPAETPVVAERPPAIAVDSAARVLSFDRGDGTVGIYDLEKKQLLRTIGSQEFVPQRFAMDPGGRQLFVADGIGNVAEFSITPTAGLDAFERRRRRSQTSMASRFAHLRPVTAITPVGYGGGYATGDDRGEIKVWGPAPAAGSAVQVDAGEIVELERFGGGKFLFGAIRESGKGKIVFWKLENGVPVEQSLREHAQLQGAPTRMTQLASGGGLGVGDSTGEIRLWMPNNGRVQLSTLKPFSAPVSGLALLPDGTGAVASDEAGNVRMFKLPIADRKSIELRSVDAKVLAYDEIDASFLIADQGAIDVVSLSEGKPKLKLNTAAGESIRFAVPLATSPSKMVAASTDQGTIDFFDLASSRLVGRAYVPGSNIKLSRTKDKRAVLFASDAGEFGLMTAPSDSVTLPSSANSAMLATDMSRDLAIVIASENRLARLYDTTNGRVVSSTSLASIPGEIKAMSMSNAVALFATDMGSLWIWQSDQPRSRPVQLIELPEKQAIVAITIGEGGKVRVADQTGNLTSIDLATISAADASAPTSSKFASDFQQVSLGETAVATAKDNVLSVQADGLTQPLRFTLASGKIASLAVSPRSSQVAVLGDQGECWLSDNAGLGEPLGLPQGFKASSVAWAVDGSSLLLTDGRRLLTVDAKLRNVIAVHDEPQGVSQLLARAFGGCVFVDSKGMVRRRDLLTRVWSVNDPVVVNDFAWSKTGDALLAVTETGQLWEIDGTTGTVSATHQVTGQSLTSVHAFANSLILAIEGDTGRLVDCSDAANPVDWAPGKAMSAAKVIARDEQSRIAIVSNDGKSFVLDLANAESAAEPIAVEGSVESLIFVDASTVAVKLKDVAALRILPMDENGTSIGGTFDRVTDLISIPGKSAVAICDGSKNVSVVDLTSKQSRLLPAVEGTTVRRLVADSAGVCVAGISASENLSQGSSSVLMWSLKNVDAPATRIDLDSQVTSIAFSPNGGRIFIGCLDKTIRAFTSMSDSELERSVASGVPLSLEVIDDNTLWTGTDSGSVEPIVFRLVSRFASDNGSVRLLKAIQDKLLLVASDARVFVQSLAPNDGSAAPILLGKDSKEVLTATIRSDAKAVAVSFGGEAPRVDVWRFGGELPWGSELEPSLTVPLVNASDTLEFVSESKLLVGQRNGLIQLIDLANQKPAFQFVGHQSPVAVMVLTDNGNQLLSCSGDRSVRRWSLPVGSLSGTEGEIPVANASVATDLNEIAENAAEIEEPEEEDAFAEVREALLTGSGVSSEAQVFTLFEDDKNQTESVADKFREIKSLEAAAASGQGDVNAAIAQLAKARKEFHDERKSLASLRRASGSNTFADNQPNLLFNTQTKFNFSAGVRTVETQISDGRFVYAAMPPGAQQPGSLFVWDFGVSGVQTHAWDELSLNIRELFGLPDGRGVLTMPDLQVFSQDGTSRPIAEALRYATSSNEAAYGENRLFAIANRGVAGKESVLLQVFRNEDLLQLSAEPVATLSGFESEVTAMTFANTHRAIAFSIRERTGYRMLLADPTTMEPRSITLIEEGQLDRPWLFPLDADGNPIQQEPGVSGPTTLVFSPDDRMLLVHSQVSREKYTYSVYRIDWPKEGLPLASQVTRFVGPADREGPFFDLSSNRPLFFVTKTHSPSERAKWNTTFASSNLIAFRSGNELQVINGVTGAPLRRFPLLTSGGVARYSVTTDGQWVVTADDRGYVKIGNLSTGKIYDLTADGRPAHAGPVVGVTISDTDSSLQLPEYVVTVGEENRLKVWDVLSRLK